MTEKTMAKADLVTSIVLMAFGIAIVVLSAAMPTMADYNQSVYSAPGIVPAIIGGAIFLLSFAMFIRSLRRKAAKDFYVRGTAQNFFKDETTKRIFRTLGLCILYALSLGRVWFPIPTFIFVFVFIVWFEYDAGVKLSAQTKKILIAALIALISTASVTLVFQELFLVNLP